MAVIGFICFVTVLGNFYQAIYDEIIYDNFGTGKEYSFHFHLCRKVDDYIPNSITYTV